MVATSAEHPVPSDLKSGDVAEEAAFGLSIASIVWISSGPAGSRSIVLDGCVERGRLRSQQRAQCRSIRLQRRLSVTLAGLRWLSRWPRRSTAGLAAPVMLRPAIVR